MNKRFVKIVDSFHKISKQGFIKAQNGTNTNAGGLTLEKLLGKKPDSDFFPDYNGVEIKTTHRYSRYAIKLFSIAFDGPNLYEANDLVNKYGQLNALGTQKTLSISLLVNQKRKLNNQDYYFELKVDETNEEIYLNVYNKNLKYIEKRGIVLFSSIKKRLFLKLNYTAILYCSKKVINNVNYYRYYKIYCCILKDFTYFIKAIKEGNVKLLLNLRYIKYGDTFINKSNNLSFLLSKREIGSIFYLDYYFEK